MRRGWQMACLAFLALFALGVVESLQLSLRDALGPGPGFFPFGLSAIGAVMAALLLVQVSRAPAEATLVIPEPAAGRRVLGVYLVLVATAVLLGPLGFRLTSLGFCVVLLVVLGVRRWWVVALFAVAGSFGVFHVFYDWLKVPLPIGVLGI
jgi:putative tricarboxylic transport membrane protein